MLLMMRYDWAVLMQAYYSFRDDAEQLDCEGAVAIKSGDSSIHSDKGHFRALQHTSSALTAALAEAAASKAQAAAAFTAHGSLDISRFNSGVEDMDLVSPRLARQPLQHQQSAPGGRVGSTPNTPRKQQRMGLLSSALNAAAAGKGLSKV